MFAGAFATNAQTYVIQDINLRNKLINDYPTLMNNQGELIISAAQAMSVDLILDNSNISNADGLQFFTSTGILKIRNNKLTNLSQLGLMKNLRRAYINGNKITTIPNLSALYQLIDLFIADNKITSISGLENITTLQFLNFAGNEISEIPDLSKLVNLKTLSVGYNPIILMPDLSMLLSLQRLEIDHTTISIVPSLSKLINLEIFNCDRTNYSNLSDLDLNTKLVTLIASNSKLSSLPILSNKPNLTTIDVTGNYLTFEDLLPLTTLTNVTTFNYTIQQDISIPLFVDVREKNIHTYNTSIDASITTNTYTWFKNGTPILINSVGTYTLDPIFLGDSGSYAVQITNAALPNLTLRSNASKLITRPCIEINKINLEILSSDCREGSLIDLEGTIVDGAVLPVYFMLQSTSPVTNITGTTATQFSKIIPGTYVLEVTDSRNCTTKKTFSLDKGADCEFVFSPNGDGIMDNYFIPNTGTVEIYNTAKKLIKTLQVPASWDGSTNNGSLADAGYYVIIINGSSSFGISLMR